VPEEVIKELLEAAMQAPSARNEQPWHFVVIKEREILDAIPKFHPYSQMLREAPLAILVCGDCQLAKDIGYIVQDCAAATQNILLAVHSKGLGAVWLGIYPRAERIAGIRQLLNIPEHIIPISLIAIGYPAEAKPPERRYNATRIHNNRW